MVPANNSILPPGPNGNLALQPGYQSRVYPAIQLACGCGMGNIGFLISGGQI
jgi:hypothetical protein